MEGIEEEWY